MTAALATMRVDYDAVRIKNLDVSKNKMLEKRRKKHHLSGKQETNAHQYTYPVLIVVVIVLLTKKTRNKDINKMPTC